MKGRFRLRKPLFFPLNYGDHVISDFRSLIDDFNRERERRIFCCGSAEGTLQFGTALDPELLWTLPSVICNDLCGCISRTELGMSPQPEAKE